MTTLEQANLAIKCGDLNTLRQAIAANTLTTKQLFELMRTAIMPDSKSPRHANQRDLVLALIDAGAEVNRAAEKGPAPLRGAVSVNDLEIAALLLERGAHPDGAVGDTVRTPLQEAQQSGHSECEALLRRYGATR